MMDNLNSMLFIRGELPVMDAKYDILKHPNILFTTDGKGQPYRHGAVRDDVATIVFERANYNKHPEQPAAPIRTNYVLLSSEDLI